MEKKKRRYSSPTEVHVMIAQTFQETFSPEWIKTHLSNPTHDLIILRHIIPWQLIINCLVPLYNPKKGRTGHSLRILVATSILSRLRQLSDRKVIERIQENRYIQYFCNVPDRQLRTFLHPSTLCRFRQRLGEKGISVIEEQVFERLKGAGVINAETMLMDSTVLESPIIYPTDVRLLYNAFDKMATLATHAKLDLWWDQKHVKQRWRAYNLEREERLAYLSEFYTLFEPALKRFKQQHGMPKDSPLKHRWDHLLELLTILKAQTELKLAGQSHIDNRLVSLDDLDARPIKKGKRHPKTEFGTTLQMTFNRQGFMITTENFIGKPNDKTLYAPTLELFQSRMQTYPQSAVTDRGYRSAKNLKRNKQDIDHVFMGKSGDVDENLKDTCLKARSATEGFIAVAKHLRGFGRSLYRNLKGARIWTLLNQNAYNLKKFLQLYRQEALKESTLVALDL
jgi:IS5 family transposase